MLSAPRRPGRVGAGLALALLAGALPAGAGVLDRIAEDGALRAGTRANAPPFAQKTTDEFKGFSVDLIEEIRAATERKLGRKIRVELSAVTPTDRLQRVAAGELDIVCGITTPTWKREDLVDFSLPFFRDGTRIMVYREQANRNSDIGQFHVGVVRGTTTIRVMRDRLPTAKLRFYPDMGDAMRGLASGEVQGVANVGVVLLGLAKRAKPRRSVVLLPRTRSLETEALACILPQDDSAWRDLVNRTLIDMYAHIADFAGRYEELYDRWFGRGGELFYPLNRGTRTYLSEMSIWAR